METEENIRKKILKISPENPKWTYKKVAKEVKVSRNTVARTVKKFKEELSVSRKRGTGRKKGSGDQNKAKNVVRILRKNPNVSEKKLAQKVRCSKANVRKIKSKSGFKTFKVQKVPDRNAKKNIEPKTTSQKTWKRLYSKIWLLRHGWWNVCIGGLFAASRSEFLCCWCTG